MKDTMWTLHLHNTLNEATSTLCFTADILNPSFIIISWATTIKLKITQSVELELAKQASSPMLKFYAVWQKASGENLLHYTRETKTSKSTSEKIDVQWKNHETATTQLKLNTGYLKRKSLQWLVISSIKAQDFSIPQYLEPTD